MFFSHKIDSYGAWKIGNVRHSIYCSLMYAVGTEPAASITEYAARHGLTLVTIKTPEQRRAEAYKSEADPLQLAALSRERRYGVASPEAAETRAAWLAKIAEIKTRYPET